MEFVTIYKFRNNRLSTENKITTMNVKLSLYLIQHITMNILWASGVLTQHWTEMSDQLHVPDASPPHTHWTGGW
jgi:hypothetical protein